MNTKDEKYTHNPKVPDDYWLSYIKDNLYYEDGYVYSKKSDYNKPLGSLSSSGYLSTVLEPKRCKPRKTINIKLHHLVWFLNTGIWAEREIDHIDKNKLNNKFDNLRLSNRQQQKENSKIFFRNGEENKYIQYKAKRKVYYLVVNRKYIKSFKTIEDARQYRDKHFK
jgi:hypothetical protein